MNLFDEKTVYDLHDEIDRLLMLDPRQAESLAEKAKTLTARQPRHPLDLESTYKLLICKVRTGNIQEAEALCRKFIDQAKRLNNPGSLVQGYNLQAGILLGKGLHLDALSVLLSHLEEASGLGDGIELGKFLNNIGVAYERLGDLPRALDYYQQSLEQKKATSNFTGIAYTSHNIGMINYLLQNYAEARKWNQKALDLLERMAAVHGRAPVLNLMGLIEQKQGNPLQAKEIHLRALEFARQADDGREISESLTYLAMLDMELGEVEKASELIEEALCLCRSYQDYNQEVGILIAGAKVELADRQYDRALATLARAEQLALSIGSKAQQRDIRRLQAKVQAKAGLFEDAYNNLEDFIALEESLRGAEVEQRIRALMIPLDLRMAKAEAEVQRLKALEMEHLTLTDPLTGLGNRRKMKASLARLLSEGAPFAIALVDADHFKKINDQYSHSMGDQVLVRLARLISETSQQSESFRFGGEEFVLLVHLSEKETGRCILEKLREDIAQHPWSELEPTLQVTVSIGVAHSWEASSAEPLIQLADQRLYQAKAEGRNRVISGED